MEGFAYLLRYWFEKYDRRWWLLSGFVPLRGETVQVIPTKQDVGTSKGVFSTFLMSTSCFRSGSPPRLACVLIVEVIFVYSKIYHPTSFKNDFFEGRGGGIVISTIENSKAKRCAWFWSQIEKVVQTFSKFCRCVTVLSFQQLNVVSRCEGNCT